MKQFWLRRGNKAASITEQGGVFRVSLWVVTNDQPDYLLAVGWQGKTLKGAQRFAIGHLGGEKPWEIRLWQPCPTT